MDASGSPVGGNYNFAWEAAEKIVCSDSDTSLGGTVASLLCFGTHRSVVRTTCEKHTTKCLDHGNMQRWCSSSGIRSQTGSSDGSFLRRTSVLPQRSPSATLSSAACGTFVLDGCTSTWTISLMIISPGKPHGQPIVHGLPFTNYLPFSATSCMMGSGNMGMGGHSWAWCSNPHQMGPAAPIYLAGRSLLHRSWSRFSVRIRKRG